MPKLTVSQIVTIIYRVAVLVALLSIAWSLRSIDRNQYTGQDYSEEQRSIQAGDNLDRINKTLEHIEKNTRR